MARIAIDAHAIGERLTGNETYVSNLIDGLMGLDSGHEYVLLFTSPQAAHVWQQKYPQVCVKIVWPRQPLVRIPLVMPLMARDQQIDLLHVQYVGPPVTPVPVVASIHDISFERYPEFFSHREVAQFKATIRLTAMLASRILTISECSKRDLVDIYGIPEEKVVVTYLAANKNFRPPDSKEAAAMTAQRYGVSAPYFLAVGNLQPRKNLVRLVAAYERLRNHRPDIGHQLVIVGKKTWKFDPILSFVQKSRWADDIILTDYVSDEDLPLLYAGADVFIYPSIYEGFGLPPLEAMACGTPVVVSDRASLPEVVGDAGVKVNPFDINAIAAAMASIVLEPGVAEWYSHAGIKRAGRFTWEECSVRTQQVYEEVCREARH